MLLTPDGSATAASEVQLANAPSFINLIDEGIFTELMYEQY
jgi:hypothetical protein